MFCHNCGHEIKKGHKFCTECGMAVASESKNREVEMMVCKECGGTLKISSDHRALKCPYCGSEALLEVSDDVEIARIRKETEIERMRHEKEKRILEEELKIKKDKADWKNFFGVMIGLFLMYIILFKFVIPFVSPEKRADETIEETAIEERVEFDGYGNYNNQTIRVGDFIFSVPEYWKEENVVKEDDYECHQLYAETDGKVAMLDFSLSYDDIDEVTYELLVDDNENMIDVIAETFDGEAEFYEEFTNANNLKGYMYKYSGKVRPGLFTTYPIEGLYSVVPSYRDNSWLFIVVGFTDNTEYTYYNDYKQIIQSLKYAPIPDEDITTKDEGIQKAVNEEESKEEKITKITQDSALFQKMLKMDYDELYEFAKEYRGATLVFDGSVDYHAYYENYKTRFNILVSYGDYSETSQVGPTFRFKDVNALELTGESYYGIPYFTETGDNVHITGKIEEFNPNTGIFELSPGLVKAR